MSMHVPPGELNSSFVHVSSKWIAGGVTSTAYTSIIYFLNQLSKFVNYLFLLLNYVLHRVTPQIHYNRVELVNADTGGWG